MVENEGNSKARESIKSVKVLGLGCSRCKQLENVTRRAIEQLGLDVDFEHVSDPAKISSYGVMSMPALVIDGKVASYGKVLKTEEVVELLKNLNQ